MIRRTVHGPQRRIESAIPMLAYRSKGIERAETESLPSVIRHKDQVNMQIKGTVSAMSFNPAFRPDKS